MIRDGFSLLKFKTALREHRISMCFQGMFSQDVLSLIGLTLRNAPDSQRTSKRLFALVVEMTQNIHHYSAQKMYSAKDKRHVGVGVIAISETPEFYQVSSGNYAFKNDAKILMDRSRYINSLDEESLKNYYAEMRRQPQRPDKPGANLGLIDMRRKSGQPIDVLIEEVDQNISFYTLTVRIRKES